MSRESFSECRVLVTGGTGFIGWHLCSRLVDMGADAHALSRRATHASVPAGCRPWAVDLGDFEELQRAVNAIKPHIIYHLASLVDGRQDRDLVLPTVRNSFLGSVHVAMACDAAGARLIAVGSSEEIVDEAANGGSRSPYATAKAAAALYYRMFHRLYGLPVVVVRPFLTYGPRQNPTKLIPYAINNLLRGIGPYIGSGDRRCDFIYIDDVVNGLCKAGLVPEAIGETVDLGTGVGTSIREVINLLAVIAGDEAQPTFASTSDRLGEPSITADAAHARTVLGWQAQWSLRDGLSATVAWHRRALETVS